MTEQSIQKTLAQASVMILKPLIKLLLRYGISYQAFCELAKRAYIDVATEDFALPGKKQTISRISTITGLSRKEIARVNALPEPQLAIADGPVNRAARVIHGWGSDTHYLNSKGQPKDLPFEGEYGFAALVKTYSGDISAKTIADELVRTQSVVSLPNHQLRLQLNAYVPSQSEAQTVQILGSDVADLIATIGHNVVADDAPYFQRKVSYHNISESSLMPLQQALSEQAQGQLEALRDTFKTVASSAAIEDRQYRVGVGIYYFQAETIKESGCSSDN
ncbi:MAG: hypothetical protein HOM11_04725 [Methylococcales bacterium]|mgnify:CR=1 FL=1|jgi:hypothetical protein|nr:hypothetical protein [Methylococcales bacterium]MBT7445892.1 hypothetical protein [Methylococcales bacterium]